MKKEAKRSDMKFWLVSAAIVIILFAISISLNFFLPPPEKFELPAKDFSNLNPDAVVQVDEFSDFTCPNSRTSAGVDGQLREYYGKRINFTYKHFLITGEEPAVMAAQASECARDQGRFWEYHDILYSNFGEYDIASLKRYAEELGLDTEKFNRCIGTGAKMNVIISDINEGESRSIRGTPTFLVNGRPAEGSVGFGYLKQMIDEELASWQE